MKLKIGFLFLVLFLFSAVFVSADYDISSKYQKTEFNSTKWIQSYHNITLNITPGLFYLNHSLIDFTDFIESDPSNRLSQTRYESIFNNLQIDDDNTYVDNSGNMTLIFSNTGQANVTIESVYVNDTYVPLSSLYAYYNDTWVPLTSSYLHAFEIGIGESMELTIQTNDLESIIGLTINDDDELVILIRTEEGAEIYHEEIVIP